jgi:hypothetical protein
MYGLEIDVNLFSGVKLISPKDKVDPFSAFSSRTVASIILVLVYDLRSLQAEDHFSGQGVKNNPISLICTTICISNTSGIFKG